MRTTVDLDDDVYHAVKELARRERRSAGTVLSALAREALTKTREDAAAETELGFRPLPHRGPAVSNELIDRLRDEDAE